MLLSIGSELGLEGAERHSHPRKRLVVIGPIDYFEGRGSHWRSLKQHSRLEFDFEGVDQNRTADIAHYRLQFGGYLFESPQQHCSRSQLGQYRQ